LGVLAGPRAARDRHALREQARIIFQKGGSLATAMAFQFASTNLVFEIGIVMWIFLGWRFTLAEFVGGLLLIVLMWAGLRLVVSRLLEERAGCTRRPRRPGTSTRWPAPRA
jgi:hypothetical protein